MLTGLATLLRRRSVPSGRWGPRAASHTRAERVAAAIALVIAASAFARLAGRAITEQDSLMYHLPAVATWIQAGTFVPIQNAGAYYPYTFEAIAALFTLPFGEDFLVAFPSWAAWMLFGLGIYCLAIDVGARWDAAFAAVLLALTAPLVRSQVPSLHVDLRVGGVFLAGIHAAASPRSTSRLLLLGSCTALLVGTKTSGIVYAGLLVLTATAVSARQSPPTSERDQRPHWTTVAVVAAGALGIAVFWYARNVVVTGNPLGDVEVRLGQLFVFPGSTTPSQLRRTTLLALFDWSDAAHRRILLHAAGDHLGLAFGALVTIGIILGPSAVRHGRRGALVGIASLGAATAFIYWSTPFSGDGGTGTGESPLDRPGPTLLLAVPRFGRRVGRRRYGPAGSGPAGRRSARDHSGCRQCRRQDAAGDRRNRAEPRRSLACGHPPFQAPSRDPARSSSSRAWSSRWLYRAGRCAGATTDIGRRVITCIQEFIASTLVPGEWLASRSVSRAILSMAPPSVTPCSACRGESDAAAWAEELRRRGVALLAIGPVLPRWRGRAGLGWIASEHGPFVRVFGQDPDREIVLYRIPRSP